MPTWECQVPRVNAADWLVSLMSHGGTRCLLRAACSTSASATPRTLNGTEAALQRGDLKLPLYDVATGEGDAPLRVERAKETTAEFGRSQS
jgi:hypothetical protein